MDLREALINKRAKNVVVDLGSIGYNDKELHKMFIEWIRIMDFKNLGGSFFVPGISAIYSIPHLGYVDGILPQILFVSKFMVSTGYPGSVNSIIASIFRGEARVQAQKELTAEGLI